MARPGLALCFNVELTARHPDNSLNRNKRPISVYPIKIIPLLCLFVCEIVKRRTVLVVGMQGV